MKIRAFLALPLTDALRAELHWLAMHIAAGDRYHELRWIPPENYHVTLHFLGDVLHAELPDLARELADALADCGPLMLRCRELGYFPYNRHPRLVLAMLETTPELLALRQAAARGIRRAGLQVERRRYLPHVTLGRVRVRRTPRLEIAPTPVQCSMRADRCVLFRSETDPAGARYHEQFSIALERAQEAG